MSDKINGRTPEEIKKGLECGYCEDCSYREYRGRNCTGRSRADALAYIQQLERERDEARRDADKLKHAAKEATDNYFVMLRERDAAVETAMFLAGTNFAFPCESDELACSEYCEKHCNFSTAQKECWLEYFRRCGAPKEVE